MARCGLKPPPKKKSTFRTNEAHKTHKTKVSPEKENKRQEKGSQKPVSAEQGVKRQLGSWGGCPGEVGRQKTGGQGHSVRGPGGARMTSLEGRPGLKGGFEGLKGAESRTRPFPEVPPLSQEETVAPRC